VPNILLKALGIAAWPEKKPCRRLQFIKAFERLLLVSTSGAFFFALVRNVPVHIQEIHLPPDWPYTLDRILRYLSLTWLLAYFFVSSVNNDQSNNCRRPKDILFDFFQALVVLSATYGLGFVSPDRGFGFEDGLNAFILSNVAVVLICLVSLLFFGCDPGIPVGLNRVRAIGLVVGVVAVLVATCATHETGALVVLLVLQCLLWLLWYAYLRIRLDQ
jgi:hypothetical protein